MEVKKITEGGNPMESSILRKAVKFLKGRKKYAVAMMSVLVVTAAGFETARPALTLEREVYCGLEEHIHTAECYEGCNDGGAASGIPAASEKPSVSEVPTASETPAVSETSEGGTKLNCTVTGPVAHRHGEGCYEEEGILVCTLEEKEFHTHTEKCYERGSNLICGKEEGEGHTHTEGCYTVSKNLICGQEEEEAHAHDDSCYGSVQELTCGKNEGEGHGHGDSCLDGEGNIACGQEEAEGHTHEDSCYNNISTGELVCGKGETEGHAHTEDCYEEVKELTCGKEETESHVHTELCYEGGSELICGKEELEEHVHGDGCFSSVENGTSVDGAHNAAGTGNGTGTLGDGVLPEGETICGKEEHTHTEECYDRGIMLLAEGLIDKGDWWELDTEGLLRIWPTESETAIPSYFRETDVPWYTHREKIISVKIEEGISKIGTYAFNKCGALVDIEIPESVIEIGSYAFYECTSLKNINIPEGIKYISDRSFTGCTSLESIVIPEGVTSIEQNAFSSCRSLSNVEIPQSLQRIYSEAFASCTSLAELTIPENVEVIESKAFANCSAVKHITWKAKKLISVGANAFPMAIQQITVDCSSVDVLNNGEILSNLKPVNIRFMGRGYFRMDSQLPLGSSMQIRLEAGDYYADDKGALYLLKDGKAALVYVPAGLTEYEVAASIPVMDDRGGQMVTSVYYNALRMADRLEGLTFAAPENIQSLPSYSCGNCPSLKAVNGKGTLVEVRALFGADAKIDPLAFDKTGIEGGMIEPPKDGVIMLENGLIQFSINKNPESGDWEFYTGEPVKTEVYVSNQQNQITYDALRFYVSFDDMNGKMSFEPRTEPYEFITKVEGEESGRKCEVLVREADMPHTYYYEIKKPGEGETLQFDFTSSYPSPSSAGGKAKMWAVLLTEEEKEALGNGVASMENGCVRVGWKTKADTFEVKKEAKKISYIMGDGKKDGVSSVRGLSYKISLNRVGDTKEKIGKDHMLSADFTDTLVLPEGLKWRNGLIDAVEAGQYSWKWNSSKGQYVLCVDIEGEEYEIIYIPSFSGNVALIREEPSVYINDKGGRNLQIHWKIENKNPGQEMNIPVMTIAFGDEVIVLEEIIEEEQSYEVENHVETVQHFTHSGDQTSDDIAIETVKSGEAKLAIRKVLDGPTYNSTYRGENYGFRIELSNKGGLAYKGLKRVEDKMPDSLYIKPQDMQNMFRGIEEGSLGDVKELTVIIKHATLCEMAQDGYVPGKEVIGTDGSTYKLSQNNTGAGTEYVAGTMGEPAAKTTDATIVISCKKGEGITLSCDGETEKSIEDIGEGLESIGYVVTSGAAYTVTWTFEESHRLLSGETQIFKIPSALKDSLMKISYDYRNEYGYTSYSGSNEAKAYYGEQEKYIYSSAEVAKANNELELIKTVAINGNVMASGSAVMIGDVLNYKLLIDHKSSRASYDILPLIDRMEGAQALLVPVEGNDSILGPEPEVREIGGNAYYVLNKSGTYTGVTLGGYLTDSITVKETAGGFDTMIRWYFTDIDGKVNRTVRYDAIAVSPSGGNTPLFSLYNTSWLNDHQGHRLYDTVGLVCSEMTVEKHIVFSQEDGEEELIKKSYVKEGEAVKYRLSVRNHGNGRTIKGTDIFDILPKTPEGFQWKKEDITISYGANADSLQLQNKDAWEVITDPQTGEQKICWGESFSFTLAGNDAMYIYITLKYPEGVEWQSYAKEYGTKELENTFYCYELFDKVWHELAIEAEAYLQKGVARPSNLSDEQSRLYYSNQMGTSSPASIIYYTVLYNSGNSRLYLNKLQDKLPRGFTYNGNGFRTTGEGNDSRPSRIIDEDGKEIKPEWREIGVTANELGDGRLEFAFSAPRKNGPNYEESLGMYYLLPGQAIRLLYACNAGTYSETDETAVNCIAMPYKDMSGAGIRLTSGIVMEGPEYKKTWKNDGGCAILNGKEAAEKGLSDEEGSNVWLASEVAVTRGKILPGITKKAASVQSMDGSVTTDPLYAKATDIINWEVTVTNSGKNSMGNYTLTDVVESPYVISGIVEYEVQTASGTKSYSQDLFQVAERGVDENGRAGIQLSARGNQYQTWYLDGKRSGRSIWLYEGQTLLVTDKPNKIDEEEYYEVRFSVNETKEEELSITFKNGRMAIKENGKGILNVPTRNTSTELENKVFYNRCYVTPSEEQPFQGDKVNQGNKVDFHGKPSVRNSAPIQVTFGYTTTSVKKVEEIGNPDKYAFSTDEKNYILLSGADSKFRYTLQVENTAANENAMKELILIDGLPQPGDHNPYTDKEPRYSEFMVRLLAEPNFKVYVKVKDKDGNVTSVRELNDDEYTLEYSSKYVFDENDWKGEGDGWIDAMKFQPSETRSFRIILRDNEEGEERLIPSGASVYIEFDAQAVLADEEEGDDVKVNPEPGATAWNSFGYQYRLFEKDTPLSATPLNVGTRIPDVPRLTKRLEDKDGKEYTAREDGRFRFLIYTGNGLKLDEEFTEAELAKELIKGNREFTIVDVDVKEGKCLSDTLRLNDLKVWNYIGVSDGETTAGIGKDAESGGNGTADSRIEGSWKETENLWIWQDGAAYTIVELPTAEEDGYSFGSLGGFAHNSYTFRHSDAGSVRISAVNIHEASAALELPETGGAGTSRYTLSGLLCLAAAGLMFGRKKQGEGPYR